MFTWLRMRPVSPWVFSTSLKIGKFQLPSWLIRGSSPGISRGSEAKTGLSCQLVDSNKIIAKILHILWNMLSQIHCYLSFIYFKSYRKAETLLDFSPLAITEVGEERCPFLDTPCSCVSLLVASCLPRLLLHSVQSHCCHCDWSRRCCRKCCHSLRMLRRAHLRGHFTC